MKITYTTSDEVSNALRREWKRHKILVFASLLERSIRKMDRRGLDKSAMAKAMKLAASELEKAV